MAVTYEPIATTTLGSAVTSIDITGISSAYTDLRVVMTFLTSTGSTSFFYLNSDGGATSNYSQTNLFGNGTSATSSSTTGNSQINIFSDPVGSSSTIPAFVTIDFLGYAGSTNKTCLITTNQDLNGSGFVASRVGLWRSTSAINAINIRRNSGNFNAGSTITLYGIKAA